MNYKQAVKAIYPTAKCYHTGDILGCLKVYHIGIPTDKTIKILVPSTSFAGNRNYAWEVAFKHIESLKTTPNE